MAETEAAPTLISVERYFEFEECGIIAPDERCELLEGMIVAMLPQTAPHSSTVYRVEHLLQDRLGRATVIRVQMSFLAGGRSVPEPDIAVVPGKPEDYYRRHPSTALLIVEVAHRSVVQDRVTKAAIYASAGIPCYWIVNLRASRVEVFRRPHPQSAQYLEVSSAVAGQMIEIDAFPGP